MADSLFRPRSFLRWRREAPLSPKHATWTTSVTDAASGTDQLIRILDEAAETGQHVAEEVSATTGAQPTANAASICRWRLLKLRERLQAVEGTSRLKSIREEALRHIDAAASAAQSMSYGYRLHNLERICDGSQALDDHLVALARIRTRLAGEA